MNRKIFFSILSIVFTLLLVGTTSWAFFTDSETSSNNTFSTGTLSIDILDQNQDSPFSTEAIISNWQPGQEVMVNFDVKNTGTLPIQLRGFATGTWGDEDLDSQNKVKVIKVERWDNSILNWSTILEDSNGITGIFYYTDNGQDTGTFFNVTPGQRAQIRLTVKLADDAGNDFQNKTFTTSLTIHARQTTSGATWPI